MSAQLKGTISVTNGTHRGSGKWNLKSLHLGQSFEFESEKFQIAGYELKIVMTREHPIQPDIFWIDLVSCNRLRLCAHVSLTITNDDGKSIRIPTKMQKAHPFHWLARHQIPMKDLTNSHQAPFPANLSVTFDLKDIQSIPASERWDAQEDLRTVQMEILDPTSIRKWLMEGATGISSPKRERSCDICRCSFVRFWASNSPDCRFWLCQRSENGNVVVKRCLNDAGLFESFGDICDDDGTGHSWVTVFQESKRSNEDFQPISADTILVFCKLQEPNFNDPSYHSYLLVPKQMQCSMLAARSAANLARNSFEANYKVKLERQDQLLVDITREQSSLDEFGVHSGSCLILVLLEHTASSDHRVIPQAPLASRRDDTDGVARGTGSGLKSLVSQCRRFQQSPSRAFMEFLKMLFDPDLENN